MPYDRHDYIDTPTPDTRLWRYMELWKLLDLLSTRTLFHCRVDLLSDVYEGATTEADVRRLTALFARVAHMYEGENPRTPEEQAAEIADLHVAERLRVYACCWNAIEPENFALWHLYAQHGVAIQTTTQRLEDAVERDGDEPSMYLGRVEYIDHGTDEAGAGNMLVPLFRKRVEFRFEDEVRSLYQSPPHADTPPAAMTVGVDPNVLIERVVVSPFVPRAAVEAVNATCHALGLTAPVSASAYLGI